MINSIAQYLTELKKELSGASRIRIEDYIVDDAVIDISGASSAEINAGGELDVTLSGASSLRYSGNPTLGDLNISGGSSLKRR